MELDDEGIADVFVEEFTDADPKDEQVAKLSRTTVRTTDQLHLRSCADLAYPLDPRRSAWERLDQPRMDDARCPWPLNRLRDPAEGYVFGRLCGAFGGRRN